MQFWGNVTLCCVKSLTAQISRREVGSSEKLLSFIFAILLLCTLFLVHYGISSILLKVSFSGWPKIIILKRNDCNCNIQGIIINSLKSA